MHNINDIVPYIDQIISATENGEMVWSRINPTAFAWLASPPKTGRIALQQVLTNEIQSVRTPGSPLVRPMRQSKILFQVFNEGNANLISVSSSDNPELGVRLQNLYALLSSGITQSGLDFLKSILPG